MLHTLHGSCHCQAVRFELDLDLAQPTLRCNCSYCRKLRCWAVLVPGEALRVTAGEAALSAYEFGARRERHQFCSHCGIRVFGRGQSSQGAAYATVSVVCLDALTEAALCALPVRHVDGANDRFDQAPAELRHL